MEDTNIEELKREFIVSEEEEKMRLKEVLKRILKFTKVTEQGEVIFEQKGLSTTSRIMLILATRYLGGRLSDKISCEVSLKELARMAGTKEKVASARVSELIKEGLVETVKRGVYRVRSLTAVEEILSRVERKYASVQRNTH